MANNMRGQCFSVFYFDTCFLLFFPLLFAPPKCVWERSEEQFMPLTCDQRWRFAVLCKLIRVREVADDGEVEHEEEEAEQEE